MAQFKNKPKTIEAEQWFPGKEIKGVFIREPEIIFSKDERLYYISDFARPILARNWLSVEKQADGKYDVLPFAFYEVKHGKIEPISRDDERYKLYAKLEEWEGEPTPYAYVVTIHGEKAKLAPGDWVITEPDGEHHYPCKPDIFEATYEPIE